MDNIYDELIALIGQMSHVCQRSVARDNILSLFEQLVSLNAELRANNSRLSLENGQLVIFRKYGKCLLKYTAKLTFAFNVFNLQRH